MAGKSYAHQLDAKNRMRIPAKIREKLGTDYTITVGTGGCLYVYTREQWELTKSKFQKVNAYRDSELKIARYLISNSWEAEEDNQGRIRMPDNLLRYAKIQKNIIVYQGPVCVEIWSEEVWNDYMSDINFDALADAFDKIDQ